MSFARWDNGAFQQLSFDADTYTLSLLPGGGSVILPANEPDPNLNLNSLTVAESVTVGNHTSLTTDALVTPAVSTDILTVGEVTVVESAPQVLDICGNLLVRGTMVATITDVSAGLTVVSAAISDVSAGLTDVSASLAAVSAGLIDVSGRLTNYLPLAGGSVTGSLEVNGVTNHLKVGSAIAPLLSADIYATNLSLNSYNPVSALAINGAGGINLVTPTGTDLNITGGDINLNQLDLTSVMNLTAAGAINIGAGGALALEAAGTIQILSTGNVSIGSGNVAGADTEIEKVGFSDNEIYKAGATDLAISDVASIAMTAGEITGLTKINGSAYPPAQTTSQWANYGAISNVDLSGHALQNVGGLQLTGLTDASTNYVLYYDTANQNVSYGAATGGPTGPAGPTGASPKYYSQTTSQIVMMPALNAVISHTFATGLSWTAGQYCVVTSVTTPSTVGFSGKVTAYDVSTGLLSIIVQQITGTSGSPAYYVVDLAGSVGPTGATGPSGGSSVTSGTTPPTSSGSALGATYIDTSAATIYTWNGASWMQAYQAATFTNTLNVYSGRGLALWFDAQDRGTYVLDPNNNVTTLRDKSFAGRHAMVEFGTPGYIQYTANAINSNPGFYSPGTFTGTIYPRAFGPCHVNQITVANYITMFGVFKVPNPITGTGVSATPLVRLLELCNSRSANNQTGYCSLQTNGNGFVCFARAGTSVGQAAYTNNVPFLVCGYANDAGNYFRYNGNATSGPAGTAGAFTFDAYSMFDALVHASDTFGSMTMGEVLVFMTPMNVVQIQQVEGYLAWKWGLVGSLPSSHPYKGAAPTGSINPS